MKLSNRRFKKLIKEGWEEIIPQEQIKRKKPEGRFLNACAVLLFCFLYGSLLLIPRPVKSDFDMDNVSLNDIRDYIVLLLTEKEI